MKTRFFKKTTSLTLALALLAIAVPSTIGNSEAALASGTNWTKLTAAGDAIWQSIASSSDGTKLVAVTKSVNNSNQGKILTSTDAGATWTEQTAAGRANWQSVASSSNGELLVAAAYDISGNPGAIFTSIDSGATWTENTSLGRSYWISVASSSDGVKLVAADQATSNGGRGSIYTSTNGGANWTQQNAAGYAFWGNVASNSDGTNLVAAPYVSNYGAGYDPGSLWKSDDSGATWTEVTSLAQAHWAGVAMSSDGTKLVAASAYTANWGEAGGIFTSTNFGSTWTKQTSAGDAYWGAVASSSDGTKLFAVSNEFDTPGVGALFASTDSGATWTEQTSAGNGFWTGVSTSSDGKKTFAVANNAAGSTVGNIWTYQEPVPVFSASSPSIPNTNTGSTSATQTETITNTGNADLVFGASAVTKTGTNAADFTIMADNCSSQTLAPNATCTVTYTFTPGGVGSRTAKLVFASNAGSGTDSVNLSATGVGLPVFNASTPSIPNTNTGSTSATQTETITNTGNADLVFGASALTKTGTNAADFTITADNCSSQTVAPSATCTVTYTFTPGGVGSRTANLVFASNAGSSPDSVTLTATGTSNSVGAITIRKIDETSGSIRGGTTVTITGTGFNAAATVTIGGLNATVTKRKGSTSITVRTPAHAAGKVLIFVTNPDSGTASYNGFTYKR